MENLKEKPQLRFYSSEDEKELARLKEVINKSDSEKFASLMSLMKLNRRFESSKTLPETNNGFPIWM